MRPKNMLPIIAQLAGDNQVYLTAFSAIREALTERDMPPASRCARISAILDVVAEHHVIKTLKHK